MTKEELEQKIREQEKTVEEAYATWPYQWYLEESGKLDRLLEQKRQLEASNDNTNK